MVYKITIPVFLVLVSIIFLVALQMTRFLEGPLFQEEFARKHEAVLRLSRKYFSSEDFSQPFSPSSQRRFGDFLEEIKSPSTARLTLWNRDHVIVFSDLKSVVGSRSPDHQDLKRLFLEEKAFFNRKAKDTNLPLQSDVGEFLDIYIPIRVSGALVAAVEIHSVVSALLSPIQKQVRTTTYILAVSVILIVGVVYYLAKNLKDERDREAALAAHNAQLYQQSRKQSVELERANRAKSEFLGIMSHELRTPLNVVMGYAGMMRDRMFGEINAEQDKALGKVISRAGEQLGMINGILIATQMESGQVPVAKTEVPLNIFLDDLRSVYLTPLFDKGLKLNWEYPPDLPVIRTDGEKLRQILQNLIDNAIKFTENGCVTISLQYFPEAKMVEFKVADTGMGIAQEAQPLIFEMFRQLDSSDTRSYGGVGLGLYIVKNLTKAIGGQLELESEAGKGSTFTVRLPCEI